MNEPHNTNLKIEYVSTDSLVPYVNNANIHTDEQIDQIADSIKEFGFSDPIGVWTNAQDQDEIIEGHGRLLAAKKLGINEVPIIRLNNLTDEQRRAYTHIHNQLTRNSVWDWDILEQELSSLDFDFESFGFDVMDIEFSEFDGQGDGGGSMMASGTRVRVVIGATMTDIDDPTHDIYDRTRNLDPEVVAAYIADALLKDKMLR